ncbi:hypothetical protein MKW98_005528 [Papaver atlanticum]|uniref:Uncharacterized protein n=1 Tax=Papaver atlanticum TaxID=357466 RepID=A0AAD4XRY0_9MAGN|nr:hypothetical protein MKW98_005528 [Papaver atlanticum]
MEKMRMEKRGHVLMIRYPSQGHINPCLQFLKRLVSKGLKTTFVTTNFIYKSIKPKLGHNIGVESISDGYDIGAKQFGLVGGSFFTQSCAVNNIYYQFEKGLLKIDHNTVTNSDVLIPGLPIPLQVSDLPSFLSVSGTYPAYLKLVLNQFINAEEADWIFINSFNTLEVQVSYLDNRIEDDNDYGLNLFQPDSSICMNWLNSRANGTVVYVSFGSMAELNKEQMEELAMGLIGSNFYFLWVVKESEEHKLSCKVLGEIETGNKGLVVKWSPQLEVHALYLGIPMVGIPRWTDQTTNAKFIEDEWRVGIRVKVIDDKKGIWTRKDLEASIREVMEGARGKVMKRNLSKWRQLAQHAVGIGGSSDQNLDEFVAKLICSRVPNAES